MTWSFDDWLRWVFDHPVASRADNAWYFAADAQMWDAEADTAVTLAHMTRLFSAPEILIGRYSPNQIGQGLWMLADPSCSSHMFALIDPGLAWPDRKSAIDAIVTLYERLFQQICARQLSHLERGAQPGNLANRICYMFWDVCPLGPSDGDVPEQDLSCLDVMRRTLAIRHCACQEGALHGLAHWNDSYPAIVADAVASFISVPSLATPPELLRYAKQCSTGVA